MIGGAIALTSGMYSFLLSILIATGALASGFNGIVTRVLDGDTIDVTRGDYTVRVRLYGVDTPEKTQSGGPEAVAFTNHLVLNKAATVMERDIDRYGRVVGTVTLSDGRVLNDEIVRAGMGRWYARYAPLATELRDMEADARTERKGIWGDPHAQAPWDFRKQEKPLETRSYTRYSRRSEPRSRRRSLRR